MKISASVCKFVISGGIATGIDFVIYLLLRFFFWPSVAKTISMICANLWSYIVNKNWVFALNKKNAPQMIVSYIMVQIVNLGINVGTNSLMLHLTGYVVLSFVVATVCAATINYTLQKKIVFN